MLRTLLLSFVLCGATAGGAMAQSYANPYNTRTRPHVVAANGRCNGVSYGTGARRCGTRTGGPAGGLTSRN